MRSNPVIPVAAGALLALLAQVTIGAQNADPDAPTHAEQPAPADKEDTTDDLFDLDELLGIKDDADNDEQGAADAPDANEADLQRKLTAQEAAEQFIEAIEQMSDTARRIIESRDVGIVTQRQQEEILIKLDVLIRHSEEGGGGSGSSSSSSQGQSSQNAPARGQSGLQQSANPEGDDGNGNSPVGGNPTFQEGRNPLLDSALASWGRLPERVRETLMQGLNDAYSSRYKSQTEEYYKRLAEDEDQR